MRDRLWRRSFLAVAAVASALSAVDARSAQQTAVNATIQDLRGVDELKTMFNRDAGKVRMVLLLSPT